MEYVAKLAEKSNLFLYFFINLYLFTKLLIFRLITFFSFDGAYSIIFIFGEILSKKTPSFFSKAIVIS